MSEMFGREKIFTINNEIDDTNVVEVLRSALDVHFTNMTEEDYLYWYRRGKQPVLDKRKAIRPEINNKIVQNVATEIVTFKNGYFLTQPTFYIARKKGAEITDDINTLNDYVYMSGKHEADNQIVDWVHTVGIGVLFVKAQENPESPFKAYALDPRNAFVVYSRDAGENPVMGVHMICNPRNTVGDIMFDVFTKDMIYRISGTIKTINSKKSPTYSNPLKVVAQEVNMLHEIPIIEYTYDRNRMGSFESVLPLLDAINNVQSNREDGIQQFIESLMVFYNCSLGEDEDGNPITPAYIRQSGAIFLKSVGQDRADLKILTEQLDQTQTQVLIDDLLKQVCDIAGMPFSTSTSASTSDNVGAVYLRSGWASADCFARNTEDLFRESNKRFDEIVFKILWNNGLLMNLRESDIDIQFTRNEMENLLVKTQGALNLKQFGYSPEACIEKSGLSNDPVGDVERSREYIDKAFGLKGEGTDNVVEQGSDSDNRINIG